MSKAYANRKPVEDRPEADFYSTPYSLTWELIKLGLLDKGTTIYEPANGSGAISSQLMNSGYKVVVDDIRTTKKDFLQCKDRYSTIVTNPPFSLFTEFVDKAKECSDKFIFITKTNFLGSQSRVEKETWKGMSHLFVFSRQVDYRTPLRDDGKFCAGNLITGWAVWDKNWKKDYAELRTIDVQKYCTLGGYDKFILKSNDIGYCSRCGSKNLKVIGTNCVCSDCKDTLPLRIV